jgi:dynein heavy chain 1, cytosolic
VQNYKPLIKDFPINDLITASDISKLAEAIVKIFQHLKKAKNVHYPIPRYLRLVEAISRDMCSKLLLLLHAKHLPHLAFDEFDLSVGECRNLFTVWDNQFEAFRESIREIAKKRNQQNLPLRVNVENRPLQERLADLHKFRRQHEELRNVITRVLPAAAGTESHTIKEINAAFEEAKDVDPLNLSKGKLSLVHGSCDLSYLLFR